MAINFCPNCFNELNDKTSVMTEVSSIFTGNNAYVLCKKCNQVLLYNINREMLFDLDDFKDDEKVIAEINELLEKADNHYEVPSPVSKCAESCEQCNSCSTQYKRRSFADKFFDIDDVFDFPTNNVKQSSMPEEPSNKEVQKPEPSKNFVDEKVYIAILKFDSSVRHVIHESDLSEFNLKEWDFYEAELHPVEIEPVTAFKITRH